MCWKRRSMENKEISSSITVERKYTHLPQLQFSKQHFESDFTFFLHLFFIVETKRLLAVIWFLFIAFRSLCYFVVSKRHKNCFHLICVKNILSYNFFSFRYSFQKRKRKIQNGTPPKKKLSTTTRVFVNGLKSVYLREITTNLVDLRWNHLLSVCDCLRVRIHLKRYCIN